MEKKNKFDLKALSRPDKELFFAIGDSDINYFASFGQRDTTSHSMSIKNKNKFYFDPHGKAKTYFDNVVLLLVIYSTITTAYYVGFDEDATGFLQIFDYLVEICFAIDIIVKFITAYKDDETGELVTDFKSMAKHYFFSYKFWVDLISTFPLYLFFNNGEFTKILRLIRLPKATKLFDSSKFENCVECMMKIKLGKGSNNHHELMRTKYISRYIYKIIKLIIFALLLTYFCGCLWHYLCRLNPFDYELTFVELENVAPKQGISRLIVSCYFALTTLATVGYGDIVPQNNFEKVMGIFLMIVGIAFFSYIMSNFNDVLINYDKKMGIVDQGSDLQVWLTSLSKFTSQKPLPRSLVKKIDQHFRFYWKNDRLSSITKDDQFLKLLPKEIRYDVREVDPANHVSVR